MVLLHKAMADFILGRSGSGKSERIHELIQKLPDGQKAILIVPEQSSFYNEKKLLQNLGEKKAKYVDVLSFRRLCTNIFDEFKGAVGQRIDDGIKAVLMSIAVDNIPAEGGEPELYGKKNKSGLKKTMDIVEPMLIAINEYKMCLITPEMLYNTAAKVESRVLAAKLRDSSRIYAAYNALLENTYEDPDDDLVRLYDLLGVHDYFHDKTVFIDSFTGFSAQEMNIIERIFSQAKDVAVSLCCDKDIISRDTSLFAESNITYRQLLKAAQKSGHTCNIFNCGGNGLRYKSKSIKAVENNLFLSFRSGGKPEPVKNDGSVMLYEAGDIYDEVAAAAKQIHRLVHQHGYRYNEIEIIARSLDEYKSVFRSEFPKYDIPYFCSDSESLENKALIRMILSVFDIIHGSFDTEAIFRYAKTGFSPLTDSEIYELENYAYIWSIRGSRWKQPFTMSPEGMKNEHSDEKELLESINRLENMRIRLITPLLAWEDSLKKAENGAQITSALYRFMEKTNCQKQFRNFIHNVLIHEGQAMTEREAGVWDKTINILNKMYTVLRDRRIDSRSYLELLHIYLKKTPVSDIPRTINSVTVGIAGSIRSENPKVVFALGCNEGIFPAQPSPVGIFTDSERRFLREETGEDERLPLYESIFGNSLKEKYNVYVTLSAPSEKLFVSWHTQGLSGGACEPSVIKNELLSILPDTPVGNTLSPAEDNAQNEDLFFTERQSFDICAELWNDPGEKAASLRKYFLSSAEYSDRAAAIGRCAEKEPFVLKDIAGLKRMFGTPLRLSSTKLDQFAACKFSYFCKFGLEAYPIRKASMDGGLYGSAMHYIFEKMLSSNKIEDFIGFDENKLKQDIKDCLDEYIDSLGDKEERTHRFAAICMRIRRNAFKTLRRMQLQFMKDSFRPVDFELRIGSSDGSGIPAYELDLPSGEKIVVSGFVDRVDTAVLGDKKYIRIIDYKTGKEPFRLANIANGIKLQMLLYLSAILKNGSEKYADGMKLLPAGVLYVPATADPGISGSASETALTAAGKTENNNFKMRGLLLENKDVLRLMENDLAGEFIPAAVTSKKELSSRSSVVSEEDFEKIFRYIDLCIKSMGEELYQGNIEAFPEKNACTYCEYKSICRFEDGDKTRQLIRYDSKSALQIIQDGDGEMRRK